MFAFRALSRPGTSPASSPNYCECSSRRPECGSPRFAAESVRGRPRRSTPRWCRGLLDVGAAIVAGGGVYLVLCRVFGVKELTENPREGRDAAAGSGTMP